jgi:hypothetical protein
VDPVLITSSVVGAGALLFGVGRQRARLRALRAAAGACGLERLHTVRSYGVIPSGITGHAGPLAVSLSPLSHGLMGGSGTLVRVHEGLARISVRTGLDRTVQSLLRGGPAFETGDPAFDGVADLEGEPAVLQALLDQTTRLGLRQLLAGMVNDAASGRAFRTRASLRGELRFAFEDDDWLFREAALPLALRGILDLARRLLPPEDVAERLAANAREDPVDTVRLRNLETLRREYPQHPETMRALRTGCRDGNEVVRLFAAVSLGAEGRTVVRRLAEAAQDDSCAARAVAALGLELAATAALGLLSAALERRRVDTAEACIDALAGRGGEECVASLTGVLANERGPVAVAAARALRYPELPGGQAVLLRHGLGHAETAVRAAAALALAEVGTVEAVLPLQELGVRGGADLRHVAREAVAAIQSRLPGAAPGQLSMSAAKGGTVSLTREGGELSLDPEADLR